MLSLLAAFAIETAVVAAPGPAWPRHTIDNTSKGADGVKLGDINRDGRPDIVTGWEEGGEVRVYLHPGAEKVRAPWPKVRAGTAKDVEDAIFTDLDQDGRLEVVSCTEGKTTTLFLHLPPANPGALMNPDAWTTVAFPQAAKTQMWMQAVTLDLDGRHGADLIVGSKNKGGAIGWLQAPPAGSKDLPAWPLFPLRPSGWVMSLVLHDMDGDGDPDLLFSDRKGAVSGLGWLANPGARGNQEHQHWPENPVGSAGREVMFMDLGDVDGDSVPDIAVAQKPVEIALFLQRPGLKWESLTLSLPAENLGDAKAVKIADLNLDGLPDLLFTCENAKGPREGIVWLEQSKTGPWKQHTLGGPEGIKFDLMQTLDLDGDGDLDVITCEERDRLGVIWYENPVQ